MEYENNKYTVLYKAVENNYIKTVKVLIEK